VEAGAAPVFGDAARLQQVIWNLLSNAVKFTPAGGHIAVSLERAGADMRLTVVDDGAGIAADVLPHIFERFRQADSTTRRAHGGLGLGLAIARQLVELHEGRIDVASAGDGAGATFTVRLPVLHEGPQLLRVPAVTPGTERDAERLPSLNGLRVLIVDDEADSRELLGAIVSRQGGDVEVVESAAAALEAIRETPPHVILSDIGMPGENGYDLVRRVRALGPGRGSIPVIAVTAYAGIEDRERALAAGFTLHMAKPAEAADLVRSIAKASGRLSS
jgi:CheY-like chemotaxis protein/anti-sigma regulatory factor (Ser/Thr protein kinase)